MPAEPRISRATSAPLRPDNVGIRLYFATTDLTRAVAMSDSTSAGAMNRKYMGSKNIGRFLSEQSPAPRAKDSAG